MKQCCIIFIILFAGFANADTLETIRQQFEIYQRHSGEIEILSGSNIQEIDNVLDRTRTKRQTVRQELDKMPEEKQSYKGIPSLLIAEHYSVPFSFYVAIERAFAHRSLQQEKPAEAMQSIQYVFRLADALSETESLGLRRAAALMRLQMLETVQTFVLNPHCKQEHHALLYTLFETQLHRRKEPDKITWTHYRKEGERFFDDAKRLGLETMVLPILLKDLLNRHALDGYESKAAERLAHDQSVFLEVMSVIIDSCEMPFYRRQPVIQRLNKELLERQGTQDAPVFAILLLQDVGESMRLFAQEQSRMEMVYLTLAAYQKRQNPHKTMNFLTGTEYQFPLFTGGIMCTYDGNIKPFYLPYRQ